jgi:flagellar biosynthesis/type III secretory pathway protein FliH
VTVRAVLRVELDEPVRAVRLLSRSAAGDAAAAAKAQWLVTLGEARARRLAESQALQTTTQAVQRTLQQLTASVGSRVDQIAAMVVELGLCVAREIVGQALDRGAVDPTATVVHCLRDCVHGPAGADLVVHLHPDDLAPVLAALALHPELQQQIAQCRILPDATLARGAVRAETGAGRLRYDPREVFERVAAAVRAAADGGGW